MFNGPESLDIMDRASRGPCSAPSMPHCARRRHPSHGSRRGGHTRCLGADLKGRPASSQKRSSPWKQGEDRASRRSKWTNLRTSRLTKTIADDRARALQADGGDIPGFANLGKMAQNHTARLGRDLTFATLGALHDYNAKSSRAIVDVTGTSELPELIYNALWAGWLCDQLAAMLAERADGKPGGVGRHDYLFVRQSGIPMHRDKFRQHIIRPALKAAGLPDSLRTYDLRHSPASLLIDQGANLWPSPSAWTTPSPPSPSEATGTSSPASNKTSPPPRHRTCQPGRSGQNPRRSSPAM